MNIEGENYDSLQIIFKRTFDSTQICDIFALGQLSQRLREKYCTLNLH